MHIHEFPSEILEEIFLRIVSQSKEHLSSPPFISFTLPPASPYLISKICKRWRDIALAFAPLWTHLHVVDPRNVRIVQHLEEWMNRAGSLSLCLSFCQRNIYNVQASTAVLALFLNSLHRCQSFEMIVLTSFEHHRLRSFERVPSTSLESVNVCYLNGSTQDGELYTNLLLNTPSLRVIRWYGIIGPLGTVSGSWGNLRELSTTSMRSRADLFTVLTHCQNLERLRIRESFHDNGGSQPVSITLPRLTHLSVKLWPWLTEILNHLTLPSLAELELIPFQGLVWAPVLDLIRRSDAVLRKLGITGSINNMALIQILKMPYFQPLRILEVEERGGQDVIEFLTLSTPSSTGVGDENEGSTKYLVHLEQISLSFGDSLTTGQWQALQKLVNSRIDNPKSVGDEYIEVDEADLQQFTQPTPVSPSIFKPRIFAASAKKKRSNQSTTTYTKFDLEKPHKKNIK